MKALATAAAIFLDAALLGLAMGAATVAAKPPIYSVCCKYEIDPPTALKATMTIRPGWREFNCYVGTLFSGPTAPTHVPYVTHGQNTTLGHYTWDTP